MREDARDGEPGGDAETGSTGASVALLVGALGRICRYGAELAALEVHERRRAMVVVSRLTAMAWTCLLTAWVGLNAALVAFAYAHAAFQIWAVLLGVSVVNGLIAGLLLWRARYRWAVVKRRPLRGLMK